MQSKPALLALFAVLTLAAVGWFVFLGKPQVVTATWDESDEFVETAAAIAPEVSATGSTSDANRAELASPDDEADDPDAPRPLITIRGRVVNGTAQPVAGAKVLLSAQSRGQRHRIEKSVESSGDGTFVFQGKGFTRLWVTLQVSHGDYAVASAFKSFDDAKGTIDMGDIKVVEGGSIVGSITDMQGNVVPGAEAQVSPMDGRMRWRRGSNDELFPAVKADNGGHFRIAHIAPGRYRISATAPRRQRYSEGPLTIVDAKQERLDPIQLGPGFELTGKVVDQAGKPLAKADVNIRGRDRRNREQGKQTNKDGEFAFDHLAPGEYSVTVRAKGFLTNNQQDRVKVTETPPLLISMEAGLKITGRVIDTVSSQPVIRYGARIQRVADLTDPDRERKIEEATRLAASMRELRGTGARTAQQDAQLKALETRIRGLGLDRGALGGLMRGGRGRGGDATNPAAGTDANARGGQAGRGRGDQGGGFGRGGGRGDQGGGLRRGGGRGDQGGGFGRGGFGRFWGGDPTRPGDTGEVETHANGEFTFDGLEEGVYVVDVGSPDHQKLRSQKIELRKAAGSPHVNLVVERGLMVSGFVLSKTDNKPIRRANVELRIIEAERPDTRQRTAEEQARAAQFRNMLRQMTNDDGPRTSQLLSTRTDGTGKFELKNAPIGSYLVRASAEGYTTSSSEVFKLDKDRLDIALEVGALAILEGRVTGMRADQLGDVQVMAYGFPRNMRSAKVEEDGTYRITGLQPGGYVVRAFVGEARRFIFRELMGGMGRAANASGTNSPENLVDVQLKEGQVRQFNVSITENLTGRVIGKVLINGAAGKGYRVSLQRIDAAAQEAAAGGGRGRGGRGRGGPFGGGRNGATVDQNGEFQIEEVEEGQYTLTISPNGGGGRGGRGGGSTILSRVISVLAGRDTTAPTVVINIGSLQGTIKIPVDPKAKPGAADAAIRGRISLYEGVTAVPDQSDPSAQQVLQFSARIRDGRFEVKDIPSGKYLLVLRVNGREQTTQEVYVGSGSNANVEATAGAVRAPSPSKGSNPGNPGGPGGGTGPGTRGNRAGPGPGGVGNGGVGRGGRTGGNGR